MEIRSYRNLWMVIISAKKMVVFWEVYYKILSSTRWLLTHRQTKADECRRLQSEIPQVMKCTLNTIVTHSFPLVSHKPHNLQSTGNWNVFYFSPYIPLVPINIYQVMSEIQTNTCVDTHWSLLFTDFNPNLNLSTNVMKIHPVVV